MDKVELEKFIDNIYYKKNKSFKIANFIYRLIFYGYHIIFIGIFSFYLVRGILHNDMISGLFGFCIFIYYVFKTWNDIIKREKRKAVNVTKKCFEGILNFYDIKEIDYEEFYAISNLNKCKFKGRYVKFDDSFLMSSFVMKKNNFDTLIYEIQAFNGLTTVIDGLVVEIISKTKKLEFKIVASNEKEIMAQCNEKNEFLNAILQAKNITQSNPIALQIFDNRIIIVLCAPDYLFRDRNFSLSGNKEKDKKVIYNLNKNFKTIIELANIANDTYFEKQFDIDISKFTNRKFSF